MNFGYSAAVKRPTSDGYQDYLSSSKFVRKTSEDPINYSQASASMETHKGSQEANDYLPSKDSPTSPQPALDFRAALRLKDNKIPLGMFGRVAAEGSKSHQLFSWEAYETAEEVGSVRIRTAFHHGLRENFFYIARKNTEKRRPTVVRFSFMEAFKLKKLIDAVLKQYADLESRFDVIPLLADDWDLATEKYNWKDEMHFWRVSHLNTGNLRARFVFSKIHCDYVMWLNNPTTPNVAVTYPNWVGSVLNFTSVNNIRRLRDFLQHNLLLEEP